MDVYKHSHCCLGFWKNIIKQYDLYLPEENINIVEDGFMSKNNMKMHRYAILMPF